ncbi:Putative neutral zinc metallopeptidase [Nonomuraea coxensis DSM 45129]|uniref:Neutral zinc metallopeptidase n=1 Tax=Nonomuraea coxensis DSM 45129 TaxID=1122611 RepID=A0ABX8U756_9ACTN|nr:neutral zinc metallopeptidase [Nonomuraea coxensis]QYC43596.1 Putative neutral zinc metallopeptidase [Nonomuraea coxensis DSM 45129]
MNSVPTGKIVAIVSALLALVLAAAGLVFVLADSATTSARPVNEAQRIASPPVNGAETKKVPLPGRRLATASPLYATGRLTDVNCSPGELPAGSMTAYRRFLLRVTACLNRAWAAQFAKADMPFSKPKLRIITGKVRTPCGAWNAGADGVYCSTDRTMYLMISRDQLRNPFPLGITRLIAHEYGHHVQQISGIWSYYWTARSSAGKAGRLLLSRRSELQAECFSSIFMSTMKGTSLVTDADWSYTVDWFRKNGAKGWPQNDHGKGPTQAAWMTRGFNRGTPAACNTWASAARNVT